MKLNKENKEKLKRKYNILINLILEEKDLNKISELKKEAEILEKLLDENQKDFRVSPDTILIVAGNLLGILLILKYEELNIITTKAMSFVIKGRV